MRGRSRASVMARPDLGNGRGRQKSGKRGRNFECSKPCSAQSVQLKSTKACHACLSRRALLSAKPLHTEAGGGGPEVCDKAGLRSIDNGAQGSMTSGDPARSGKSRRCGGRTSGCPGARCKWPAHGASATGVRKKQGHWRKVHQPSLEHGCAWGSDANALRRPPMHPFVANMPPNHLRQASAATSKPGPQLLTRLPPDRSRSITQADYIPQGRSAPQAPPARRALRSMTRRSAL